MSEKVFEICKDLMEEYSIENKDFEKAFKRKLDYFFEEREKHVYTLEFIQSYKKACGNENVIKIQETPTEIIHHENAWTAGRFKKEIQDPKKYFIGKASSILNKFTAEKYTSLSSQLFDLINEEFLPDLIDIIIEKSSWDDNFRHLYAKLSFELKEKYENFQVDLIKKIQGVLKSDPPQEEETEEKFCRWKKHRIGCGYFVICLIIEEVFPVKIYELFLNFLTRKDGTEADRIHACHMIKRSKEISAQINPEVTSKYIRRLSRYIKMGTSKERILIENMKQEMMATLC